MEVRMDETVTRFWTDLLSRPAGPLALRFVIQPVVALVYAFRDGRRDAKHGRPAYFWALFTTRDAAHRRALVKSAWQSIGKVVIAALVMDLIYQFIELKAFRPLEAIAIAFALAIVPYVLLRGPINRLLNQKPGERTRTAERSAREPTR
jgi:hypothetical protein